MKLIKSLLMTSILASSAAAVAAEAENGFSIGANIGFVANNAGGGSDFDSSERFNLYGEYSINTILSVQAGLSQTTDTEDSGSDNTGEYKLTIRSSDIFAGVRLSSNPLGIVRFYGRSGLLYYYSEIEVKESFFGRKKDGKTEEVEEGIGFYLGGGAMFRVARGLVIEAEVSYLERQEYFEDASRSFDMEEIGLLVGARYAF